MLKIMFLVLGLVASSITYSKEIPVVSSTTDVLKLTLESQNKFVLISFFATWCTFCISEIKTMNELYSSGDFKVIGINTEALPITDTDLKAFIIKHKMLYPIYKGTDQASFTKGIVPSHLIVCPNGKIAHLGNEQLTEKVLADLMPFIMAKRC